jgi:hypothetical protein
MLGECPPTEFVEAVEDAGITVRGWQIPDYRFSKRKSLKNSMKVEGRGWTDPRNLKSGDLMLTVDGDHWAAFETVLDLAETHNVYMAVGRWRLRG